MDAATSSAGPWLVLGAVLGVLLAALGALALVGLRRGRRADRAPAEDQPLEPAPQEGWSVDDLPGFLDRPPGTEPPTTAAGATQEADDEVRLGTGPLLLDAAPQPRRRPAHRAPGPSADSDRTSSRMLLGLSVAAVLLVGTAAGIAAATGGSRGTATATPAEPSRDPEGPEQPAWTAPDVTGVPAQPSPGDPGAGLLASTSVPIGPDGALARATFEGLVLERRAVGVTVTYPAVSVTSADATSGPALAHVRLPVWNCLRDTAPADPVAAGCRQVPTQHAELGTPALSVTSEGDGLRISGRFPTYLRPTGSPPDWTGQVYPLTAVWTPEGGTLHLGPERAAALDDPRLTELRLGR